MARVVGVLKGRWRPLIITAASTGMRASELCALEWTDVLDLDSKYPNIRVHHRGHAGDVIVGTKSGTEYRYIPLSPLVVTELLAWREACPRDSLMRLVFPNGKGRVQSNENLRNSGWIPAQIKACVVDGPGNAKYGVQALRHFYASLLIDHGLNAKMVQVLLGDSTLATTLKLYGHLFRKEKQAVAIRLAALETAIVSSTREYKSAQGIQGL